MQVIGNACATQAILSVLLNWPGIDLGDELRRFKAFTETFPPPMKGLAITNSTNLRVVHNSFARPVVFEADPRADAEEGDAYHFVSYVPHQGHVYELDGLKPLPVDCGAYDGDWATAAIPHLQRRLAECVAARRPDALALARHRRAPAR